MTPQIMVPLDGSDFSEQALRYAYQLATRMRARIHLVRVLSAEALAAENFFFDAQAHGDECEAARNYLVRICEDGLWHTRTDSETAVLRGPVAGSLAAYASEHDIDLVIMTTHGRGGISRAWLGSVADELVRQLNIPILLLRPLPRPTAETAPRFDLDHIVIPLDGSAAAERAIGPALRLGELTGARYTLLEVVPPLMVVPASEAIPIAIAAEDHSAMRAQANAYLGGVASRLRADGYLVDTAVVVQSQCAAGIIEHACETEASLISMATHGRSGLKRWALGSIADKVLRGTALPLLLLRPDPFRALSASA